MMEQQFDLAIGHSLRGLYPRSIMGRSGKSVFGSDPGAIENWKEAGTGGVSDDVVASSSIACATFSTHVFSRGHVSEDKPWQVEKKREALNIVISKYKAKELATEEMKIIHLKQWKDPPRLISKKSFPSFSPAIKQLADQQGQFHERVQRLSKELDPEALALLSKLQKASGKIFGRQLDEKLSSCISVGDLKNARIYTKIARLVFPGDYHFRKIHKILAPPKIISMKASKSKSINKTVEFLKKFGKEHLNKWIAVSEGQLLRVSGSYAELANEFKDRDVIITKVV